MRVLKVMLMLLLMGAVSGCAIKFKSYRGPKVTRVIVYKERRQMYLMHGKRVLKRYHIDLGFAPAGDKKIEGDGKTPEGEYLIDRRNPNSAFYLSIGISYPNNADRAEARALGKPVGGDIFIHGGRRKNDPKNADWTAGCISVSDRQMRDVYAMVKNGTRISILP